MNDHKKQSFLEGLGIETSEVGTPFWKPDGRKRTVTILAARKPTDAERVKTLKDGQSLTVLAIFDVEVNGVPHRWEVSSKRLLGALHAVITGLPCELDVQQVGSGQNSTFTAEIHKTPPKQAGKYVNGEPVAEGDDKRCDAPGCILRAGHAGKHTTGK